jgi:hypothetical protein
MNKIKIAYNILTFKKIKYYSENDRDMFFKWVRSIECVEKVEEDKNKLHLYICSDELHDQDLRDLIGLLYRYKANDMKQLKMFLTEDNKRWFYGNTKGFWHRRVFGS